MTEEDIKNIDLAIKAAVHSASAYRSPINLIEVSVSWTSAQRFRGVFADQRSDDGIYPNVTVKFSP